MIWFPDTCFCQIECDRPSIDGKFIERCRIHQSTARTTTVYAYNLTHRIKPTERGSDAKERIGEERKRLVKEATKP